MATRQVLYPPFGVGTNYKIFNTFNPGMARLSQYTGPGAGAGLERFVEVVGGVPTNTPTIIDTNPPNYGTQGYYVGLATNAGGRRRKSRRSKRSKRSTRKSRRRC
jgi:hypothetical protein